MIDYIECVYLFTIIILVIILIILKKLIKKQNIKLNFDNISELSFQRYAKFYGIRVLKDENFNKKINKIYESIIKNKESDIKKIAELSNCTYDECILKIKYLKNKRQIGDYYIDTVNGVVKPCEGKDRLLLVKYVPYIYVHHYQIDEIARRMPNASLDNIEQLKEQILNELDYLDKKNLINGLNIDKVDKKIIYYTIEKHKKEKDYISIDCENCGALNDVPKKGKARCEYCDTIIEDKVEN